MLRIPTKIPVTIHTAFWVVAAVIGFLNSMSFSGTLIWIAIIFVSVLIHEFGHALTAALFGQKPRIELVAMGGVTYHQGNKLSFWKQFFIVLDGPIFGFLLFIAASLLLRLPALAQGVMGESLYLLQRVNLFWTVLNLLPVMPLDGGQLLRVILEGIFGLRGFKYSLIASMAIAVILSLFFFLVQYFLVGAIFFLLAFQSYETWKQSRSMSEPDRKEELKIALENAEAAIQSGKVDEAESSFEKIRQQAKQGIIYNLATQYLAFIKYDKGNPKEAYDLLYPLREELSNEALCLLHRAAFEIKEYPLVIELAGNCYQLSPTVDAALRNAYSCASQAQVESAVGWLETALEQGARNIQEVVQQKGFDAIRNHPLFQEFLAKAKGG